MSEHKEPVIFITYDWNDTSDLFIQNLQSSIKGVEFKIDKKDIDNWDSITQFMNTISEGDFVVQLLTDKYLKSPNCLYEVMQLMKDENWSKKTLTVVMKDAEGIYNDEIKLDYIEYWDQKVSKIEKRLNKLSSSASSSINEILAKYKTIRDNIGTFLVIASDRSNPKLSDAVKAISKKINPSLMGKEKNDDKPPSNQQTLIAIWQSIVPLVDAMSDINMEMYNPSKIEYLKKWRNNALQLATLYESKIPYISKSTRATIENVIKILCDFYDKTVLICSLENTIKGLTGNNLAKFSIAISNHVNHINKLLHDIIQPYQSLKQIISE